MKKWGATPSPQNDFCAEVLWTIIIALTGGTMHSQITLLAGACLMMGLVEGFSNQPLSLGPSLKFDSRVRTCNAMLSGQQRRRAETQPRRSGCRMQSDGEEGNKGKWSADVQDEDAERIESGKASIPMKHCTA